MTWALLILLNSADAVVPGAAWTATSGQPGSSFGASVASAGDVNGDGYDDVIVGASTYDDGQAGEGAAAVFLGSGAGLSIAPAWAAAPTNLSSAFFGTSVSTAGDVNGDGYDDVVVGAPNDYPVGYSATAGTATLYLGGPAGLASTPAWTATTGGWYGDGRYHSSRFGWSVAAAGDVNGDGFGDVIVGAPSHSSWGGGFLGEGFAFVYLGSPAGLGASPAWSRSGSVAGMKLGSSVGGAGDVNGDGYDDIVIGRPGDGWAYGPYSSGYGSARMYLGSPSGPSPSGWTAMSESDPAGGGRFGHAVAGGGDVNGDGYDDVLIGDPEHTDGQLQEGGAFLYLGSAGGLSATPSWSWESNVASAQVGVSVALAGDLNGDGYDDAVIGGSHVGGDRGAVAVFLGSPTGLAATPAATLWSDRAGSLFGSSVASAGDTDGDGFEDFIVGAPDYGAASTGGAFLFLGR